MLFHGRNMGSNPIRGMRVCVCKGVLVFYMLLFADCLLTQFGNFKFLLEQFVDFEFMFPILFHGIILIPFCSIFILSLCKSSAVRFISKISLYLALVSFLSSFILFLLTDIYTYSYFSLKFYLFSDWLDWSLTIALDSLSLLFILLTNLLIFLCQLYNYNNVFIGGREFSIYIFVMQAFLVSLFVTTNLFWFFIFFECVLIPMFFIIGIWGSRLRKIHATYYFYLYTLFGSLFMFFALIWVYSFCQTGEFELLRGITFPRWIEYILFLAFFYSFAVKVPVLPLHIWLPEAHVEAPTVGSVLLAGVLLKLGTYGILRILLPIFPISCKEFAPIIFLIGTFGIIYASFSIMRQIDLKKIIAYSSVIHMNFALLGLFSFDFSSFLGSVFLMINHGIVSSGLFFCVGMLYERYHSRLILYYGGLNLVMPVFTLCFIIFSLANFGFPGTSSFIGEFMVLVGAFDISSFLTVVLNLTMISAVCYMLWTMNRILFGPFKSNKIVICNDLSAKETFVLIPLIFFILFFGFFPGLFFEKYEFALLNLFNYWII